MSPPCKPQMEEQHSSTASFLYNRSSPSLSRKTNNKRKSNKMEEESLKRNTDCVYFLASPLTCNKGAECEYRHSEIARLNPTDCWYWLAGNCLKPACPFRHPPLEKHVGPPQESDSVSHQSSVPINKNNVPCYFYFNGFCHKGDRCFFMHGPDANVPSGKLGKTSSAITDKVLLDNKTSVGTDIVCNPTQAHPNPSETSQKAVTDLKFCAKEHDQQLGPKNVGQQCSSLQIAASLPEDADVLKSDSLLHDEVFIQSRPNICTDLSSDEKVDDYVEPDERWESSPGFDVLVDGESENYEGNEEYLLGDEREQGDLHSHFLGYDFEERGVYNYERSNPDREALLYDGEINDSFECVDNLYVFDDDVRTDSDSTRDRILDSLLSRKRKCLPMELTIRDQRGMDLRDHLRKRRFVNSYPFIRSSGQDDSYHLIAQSEERPRSHGLTRQLHGRLASEVVRNAIESLGDNGALSIARGAYQHEWHMHSLSNRPRQHYKEKRLAKRQSHSYDFPRKPVVKEKRCSQASTAFTGPKTLAQIKEEKKNSEENGNCIESTKHSVGGADFEGPKPLQEILKDKRKHGSESDRNGSSSN